MSTEVDYRRFDLMQYQAFFQLRDIVDPQARREILGYFQPHRHMWDQVVTPVRNLCQSI